MNYRSVLLPSALIVTALALGGCEYSESPTVPVMPDLRLKPAALIPDDFSASPTVVEVKVPVASPQLRPFGVGNIVPAAQSGAAAIAAAAWSCVEKILQLAQRTSAPKLTSVSIKTAV